MVVFDGQLMELGEDEEVRADFLVAVDEYEVEVSKTDIFENIAEAVEFVEDVVQRNISFTVDFDVETVYNYYGVPCYQISVIFDDLDEDEIEMLAELAADEEE